MFREKIDNIDKNVKINFNADDFREKTASNSKSIKSRFKKSISIEDEFILNEKILRRSSRKLDMLKTRRTEIL